MTMKILLALGGASLLLAGCGSQPITPGTSSDLRACIYLVPYCPPTCNLVGHCPQQCQCPNGSGGHVTLCGAMHCTGAQTCCPPVIQSIVDGGNVGSYMCMDGTTCPL